MTWLILATLLATVSADDQVPIEIHGNGAEEQGSSKNRAPMRLNIDVRYDSTTGTVTVIGSYSMEAAVYLHDAYGNVIDYSPSIDACFVISSPGAYVICIQGDGWEAIGEINV